MQTSYSPSSKLLEPVVCQAEAPVLLVVGSTVGNPVGLVGERVQVLPQLVELHLATGLERCN